MSRHVLFTRGREEAALIGHTPDSTGVSTTEVLCNYAFVKKVWVGYSSWVYDLQC